MTEDEAKTKWCFHFIASHTDPRQREWRDQDHRAETSSSEPTGPFIHHCIASACMAWRWQAGVDMRAYQGTAAQARPGYCGLAGAIQ